MVIQLMFVLLVLLRIIKICVKFASLSQFHVLEPYAFLVWGLGI
jgi:hypothetical protein